MYPPMYDPYIRADRQSLEKEKKNDGKDINYPPMPFAWPYPPFTTTPLQTSESTTAAKQPIINANSNINYNFPMHMYPQYGPPRYPPSYMDYPYQQSRDKFGNQTQNPHQNISLPPNQHHMTSQAYPSAEGPSFRCLPPYPSYPHHGYQFPHHDAAVAHTEP
jgi:hypothetical protein